MQVFIACGLSKPAKGEEDDPFRKPKPGMWRLMEQHFNSGIPIDMDQLFVFPFNCLADVIFSILLLYF